MSNKSLSVAAVVALAVSGNYSAAATTAFTPSPSARFIGIEAASAAVVADPAAVYGLPALAIDVASNGYTNGDVVTLTVTGGTVRSAADIGTVTCTDPAGIGGGAAMTWTYDATTSSGNTIKLLVGGRAGNAFVSGTGGLRCTIPLNSIKMLASSLTSAPTTVSVSMSGGTASGSVIYDRLLNGAGGTFDAGVVMAFSARQVSLTPGCSTTSAGSTCSYRNPVTNQLMASAVSTTAATSGIGFNAVIPVGGASFNTASSTTVNSANETDTRYEDIMRFVVRVEDADADTTAGPTAGEGLATTFGTNAVTIASAGEVIQTVITGDFSFVDDDANGCTAPDLTSGANTLSASLGTLTLAPDCSSVTHDYTIPALNGASSVRDRAIEITALLRGYDGSTAATAAQATGRAVSARSFSAVSSWKSTAAATTARGTFNPTAGAWTPAASTASGSATNLPYLPYGAGISRIVYATNVGTVAASASFTATANGGAVVCSASSFPAVSIPVGAVVNLGGAIDAGVRACFPTIDADSGKVQVNIEYTNSSSTTPPSIELSSAYNVSGNRNVVINSSN